MTKLVLRSHVLKKVPTGSQRPLLENSSNGVTANLERPSSSSTAQVLISFCSNSSVAEFGLDWELLPLPTMAKPPPLVGRSATGVAFSEGARNWPFVFGFAVTLGIVAWMSQNLDPKDAQKSPFINPNAHR